MTPGELEVKLDAIIDQLTSMSKVMVTRDLFDTWREGNNERMGRLESDVRRWIETSTAAHVELDKDSKARHADAESKIAALEAKIEGRISAGEDKATKIEETQKAERSRRWFSVGLAVLSSILGLIASAILILVNLK